MTLGHQGQKLGTALPCMALETCQGLLFEATMPFCLETTGAGGTCRVNTNMSGRMVFIFLMTLRARGAKKGMRQCLLRQRGLKHG